MGYRALKYDTGTYFKSRNELSGGPDYILIHSGASGGDMVISLQKELYQVRSNVFNPLYPGQQLLLDQTLLLEIVELQKGSLMHYDAKVVTGKDIFDSDGQMAGYSIK